jgi:hypothetical protein
MKVYISYCRQDREFAAKIIDRLRKNNPEWEFISYWDEERIGADYKELVSKGIRDADAFIAVISNCYNESSYASMELNWALAYNYENKYPQILPILLDEAKVPYDISHILYLKHYSEPNNEVVFDKLVSAIYESLTHISVAKKEKQAVALSETIEVDGTQFIEETLTRLNRQIGFNRVLGFIGYSICFLSLLCAILFCVLKVNHIANQPLDASASIRVGISSLFLISLLIAFARFSFIIGKVFMVEAIRNLDRLHAIDFGKLYLKFSKVIGFEWNELKETLKQSWNIDTGSAFISQNSSEIEPSILNIAVEAMKNAKRK